MTGFLLHALLVWSDQLTFSFAQSPLANLENHASEGYASWYGPNFAGRQTANGEIFDPSQLTAAHKTLPFGSYIKVNNLDNGMSVTVRINDRGPFKPGRIIDLSRYAAEIIDMIGPGTARVGLELIDPYAQQPSQVVTPSVADETVVEPATVAAAVQVSVAESFRVATDLSLSNFDVVTERYPVGKLLLLSGQSSVMVRVVSNQMPRSSGVDFFVSSEAFNFLGDSVSLLDR